MKFGSFFLLLFFFMALSRPVAAEEWQRVYGPRDWSFPRDHGYHREYKTEWWYLTGNLHDVHGRPFGYELTLFRQGLQFTPVQTASRWAIRDFYFGHLAVSDLATGRFHYRERVDRAALGQSGASDRGLHVWMQEWRIETVSQAKNPETYHLLASDRAMAIDLTVQPDKPLVFQGEKGVSHKSATPGNASYYYSYTRLKTEGTVRVGAETFTVSGTSWFDHEFSTSALGDDQAGWDWFSIQLDSGDELMLYQMRNKNGSIDAASQGTWIGRNGERVELKRDDMVITPEETWKSPQSQAVYPSRWRVEIPKLGMELEVIPAMKNQELYLMELSKIAYWEGACRIRGTRCGKPVTGLGYTELTGYASTLGKTY